MRDVKTVIEERNRLQEELHALHNKKRDMFRDYSAEDYKNMGEHTRAIFTYFVTTINKLMIQINALTFVLNEDTILRNENIPTPAMQSLGISIEDIMIGDE